MRKIGSLEATLGYAEAAIGLLEVIIGSPEATMGPYRLLQAIQWTIMGPPEANMGLLKATIGLSETTLLFFKPGKPEIYFFSLFDPIGS